METIHGIDLDSEGRCTHWHSPLDIVALRCSVCGKLYACYECHDEIEDHSFGRFNVDTPNTVMCGSCGKLMSYEQHANLGYCPECNAPFNPRCCNHLDHYVKSN